MASTIDTVVHALGQALRARRKALGISMTAAAEAAQMSRVTWHRLEKGELGVAWGFLLAAAAALDMEVTLVAAEAHEAAASGDHAPSLDEWLPLRIHLADFAGLRRLAWQVRQGSEDLSPREAWGLYERNGRHLDKDGLSQRERDLMQALGKTFGDVHATI
ncbi:MAG: helix-turn-helix domain-containing protein [Rhodanobacteraceae bacterium]